MTDTCKSDLIFEADDDLIDALEEMIDRIGERLRESEEGD